MKKTILIIFSFLSIFFLTGCYDKNEPNDLAYVVAIGIDKSKNNPENIAVTFELVIPLVIEKDGPAEESASTYTTVEAPSLYSAITLTNSYISKQLNLSHNKLIVFSEEIAANGIADYTSTISHDRLFRSNMYILISKCSAKDYLENTTSEFEKNPAKFYELLFESYKYTSTSNNPFLVEYVIDLFSTCVEPVALLGNISNMDISNSENSILYNETYKPNNTNYLPGQIQKEGISNTEIIGIAAFKNSKLVGELTGEEALYYLISTNKFKKSNYTIYDPLSNENTIDFNLSKRKNTEITVTMVDNVPLIQLKAYIDANILSINLNIDYMSNDNLDKLENELEYILKTNMKNYLYKTSKEFKADISGFGNVAMRNYLTWDEWKNVNWLDIYQFSYFDVDFDVNIDKNGLVFID